MTHHLANLKLKPNNNQSEKSERENEKKKKLTTAPAQAEREKKEPLKLQTKALLATCKTNTSQNNFKSLQKTRKVEKLTKEMFE